MLGCGHCSLTLQTTVSYFFCKWQFDINYIFTTAKSPKVDITCIVKVSACCANIINVLIFVFAVTFCHAPD